MILAMEMKQHLCRMLPESGYNPHPMNDHGVSKNFTKPGVTPTTVSITNADNVIVVVKDREGKGYAHVAECSLGDVIIGKGYTIIGSYMVEH